MFPTDTCLTLDICGVQAREYLYFKVFGTQHITPVAIMTSSAKKNGQRVHTLCDHNGWFGRGEENFRLFEQVCSAMQSNPSRFHVSCLWKDASRLALTGWMRTKQNEEYFHTTNHALGRMISCIRPVLCVCLRLVCPCCSSLWYRQWQQQTGNGCWRSPWRQFSSRGAMELFGNWLMMKVSSSGSIARSVKQLSYGRSGGCLLSVILFSEFLGACSKWCLLVAQENEVYL